MRWWRRARGYGSGRVEPCWWVWMAKRIRERLGSRGFVRGWNQLMMVKKGRRESWGDLVWA